MGSELRKNLEQVIGMWNLDSSAPQPPADTCEISIPDNDMELKSHVEELQEKAVPPTLVMPTRVRIARKQKAGFSVWTWLMSGLRDDSLAAVLVFGLLLYSAIAACAASGLMLGSTF